MSLLIAPLLEPHEYVTHAFLQPLDTHFRRATCAEVDCEALLYGWQTEIDETTDLGQGQAHYIRRDAGRRYTEHRAETGLTVFTFEAGQRCFREHQAPLQRPPIYLVHGGDGRLNTGVIRTHTSGESWIEDAAEQHEALAKVLEMRD